MWVLEFQKKFRYAPGHMQTCRRNKRCKMIGLARGALARAAASGAHSREMEIAAALEMFMRQRHF